MLRCASSTLSQLFVCKPTPDLEIVRKCLPVLSLLIYSLDEDILANACWALSRIADNTHELI